MAADESRLATDRRKALGLAISQIEKQLGKGSIMRMGAESARVKVPAIPLAKPNGNGNGHGHTTGNGTSSHAESLHVVATTTTVTTSALDAQLSGMMGDAPFCDVCGHITVRNGACYKCLNCGNSLGCS